MGITNIPFSSNFLSTLSELIEKDSSSFLIVMPNKRSERELITIYSQKYKKELSQKIITYSKIPDNLNFFTKEESSTDIIPPCIDNLELRCLLHSLISNCSKFRNIEVNQVINAISEFYYYRYNLDDLKGGNDKEKDLLQILLQLEKHLSSSRKLLEPQRCNLALEKLLKLAEKKNLVKIYAILPASEVPYVSDFINLITKLDNGSRIITQGFESELNSENNIFAEIHNFKLLRELNFKSENYVARNKSDDNIKHLFEPLSFPKKGDSYFNNIKIINSPSTTEEAKNMAAIIGKKIKENLKEAIGIITADRKLAKKLKAELSLLKIDADDTTGSSLFAISFIQLFAVVAEFLTHKEFDYALFLEIAKHPSCIAYEEFEEFTKLEISKNQAFKDHSFLMHSLEGMDIHKKVLVILDEKKKVFQKNHYISDLFNVHIEIYKEILKKEHLDEFLKILEENFPKMHRFTNSYLPNQNYCSFILPILSSSASQYSKPKYKDFSVKILTPMEARFLQFDLCIFMGLEDGIFPKSSKAHGIISNQLRKKHDDYYMEKNITSNAAFDFASIISQKSVILSYSCCIPTRWLELLKLHLKNGEINSYKNKEPSEVIPIKKAEFNPDLEYRPKKISASGIELLMNDPYIYYLKYILKLQPLEKSLNKSASKVFGILLHQVLAKAVHLNTNLEILKYQKKFMDIYDSLTSSIQKDMNYVKNLWKERIIKIAEWFFRNELQNYVERRKVYTETPISCYVGGIKISAVVDRIDVLSDGKIKIIDYKTGTPPSNSKVCKGLSPQLPIEAFIISNGGSCIEKEYRQNLESYYIEIHGKRSIGKNHHIKFDLNSSFDGIRKLIGLYLEDNSSFISSSSCGNPFLSDYKKLSRAQEWLQIDL